MLMGYANVIGQGGKEEIEKNARFKADAFGFMIDGIYVPKTGTVIAPYTGDLLEVSQGI